MGIRRYEVTSPATSSELRQQVASHIGQSAVSTSIHVGVQETGVDIPAANARTELDFGIAGTRLRDGGLSVLGEASDGGTVHLDISPDGELPATLTIVTAD